MTLIVKPLKGYLTHDTNFFTSMDPYCYLYLGKQAQKTSPHYGGGIRPTWKETLKFKIQNITKLGIEIWAKALIGNDTLIGQGLIDLRKLNFTKGDFIQEYVDIIFDNKAAGRVLLQLQFANPQNTHQKQMQTPVQNVPLQKHKDNGWDIQKKPQRNSWAGDVNWRGSNVDDKNPPFQPSSAIYIADGKPAQGKTNSPAVDNPYGLNQMENRDFKKKPVTAQQANSKQTSKTQQQRANQFLNQQILKNFIPKQSNAGNNSNQPPVQKQTTHQNQYQQQMLYQQKLLEQQKKQQQMIQQYPQIQNPFQNNNYVKPQTGLTPGTVYAQPDKLYNPNRKSNVGRGSNVGIGNTPPKSILTPPKANKPKSPGKKVQFADNV